MSWFSRFLVPIERKAARYEQALEGRDEGAIAGLLDRAGYAQRYEGHQRYAARMAAFSNDIHTAFHGGSEVCLGIEGPHDFPVAAQIVDRLVIDYLRQNRRQEDRSRPPRSFYKVSEDAELEEMDAREACEMIGEYADAVINRVQRLVPVMPTLARTKEETGLFPGSLAAWFLTDDHNAFFVDGYEADPIASLKFTNGLGIADEKGAIDADRQVLGGCENMLVGRDALRYLAALEAGRTRTAARMFPWDAQRYDRTIAGYEKRLTMANDRLGRYAPEELERLREQERTAPQGVLLSIGPEGMRIKRGSVFTDKDVQQALELDQERIAVDHCLRLLKERRARFDV